jgi:hypothetical protein
MRPGYALRPLPWYVLPYRPTGYTVQPAPAPSVVGVAGIPIVVVASPSLAFPTGALPFKAAVSTSAPPVTRYIPGTSVVSTPNNSAGSNAAAGRSVPSVTSIGTATSTGGAGRGDAVPLAWVVAAGLILIAGLYLGGRS